MPANLDDGYYTYAGYIHPLDGDGGIEATYFAKCEPKGTDCKGFSEDKVKERFYKIVSSIEFTKK